MKTLLKFIRNDQGMETVEWALVAAVVTIVITATAGALGANVKRAFQELVGFIPS